MRQLLRRWRWIIQVFIHSHFLLGLNCHQKFITAASKKSHSRCCAIILRGSAKWKELVSLCDDVLIVWWVRKNVSIKTVTQDYTCQSWINIHWRQMTSSAVLFVTYLYQERCSHVCSFVGRRRKKNPTDSLRLTVEVFNWWKCQAEPPSAIQPSTAIKTLPQDQRQLLNCFFLINDEEFPGLLTFLYEKLFIQNVVTFSKSQFL